MIIAITGSLCSGKTTVAKMFSKLGAKIVNADKIGHSILEKNEVKTKLTSVFGKKILDKNKKINRRTLGKIVFSNKKSIREINRIMHPLMAKEMKNQAKLIEKQGKTVIVDAALMKELKIYDYADKIIKITCSRDKKIQRAAKKGFSKEHSKKILAAQSEAKRADYIINNNKTLKETERQVKDIWRAIQK